jgi:hypothetical protein
MLKKMFTTFLKIVDENITNNSSKIIIKKGQSAWDFWNLNLLGELFLSFVGFIMGLLVRS